jgi:hypothetical protein
VEELLLEVGPWRFSTLALGRHHSHIPRRGHLHLAVDGCGILCPTRVGVGSGTKTASEKGSQTEICVGKASRVGRKSQRIRSSLVVKRNSGILRQTLIGGTKASKNRSYIGGRAVSA